MCLKVIENGSKVRNLIYLGVHKVFIPESNQKILASGTKKNQTYLNDLDISDDSDEDEVHGTKVLPSNSSRRNNEEEKVSPTKSKRAVQEKNSVSGAASISKASQRKKDLDDMNKSIDSLENYIADSKEEGGSKISIIVSLKHIKGQEPQL